MFCWGSRQICHGNQPRGRTGEQRIYTCTSSFRGSEHVDAVEGGVRIAADDFELPVDPNAFPTTARTSSLVDALYSARATALDVGGCVWATGQAPTTSVGRPMQSRSGRDSPADEGQERQQCHGSSCTAKECHSRVDMLGRRRRRGSAFHLDGRRLLHELTSVAGEADESRGCTRWAWADESRGCTRWGWAVTAARSAVLLVPVVLAIVNLVGFRDDNSFARCRVLISAGRRRW